MCLEEEEAEERYYGDIDGTAWNPWRTSGDGRGYIYTYVSLIHRNGSNKILQNECRDDNNKIPNQVEKN